MNLQDSWEKKLKSSIVLLPLFSDLDFDNFCLNFGFSVPKNPFIQYVVNEIQLSYASLKFFAISYQPILDLKIFNFLHYSNFRFKNTSLATSLAKKLKYCTLFEFLILDFVPLMLNSSISTWLEIVYRDPKNHVEISYILVQYIACCRFEFLNYDFKFGYSDPKTF